MIRSPKLRSMFVSVRTTLGAAFAVLVVAGATPASTMACKGTCSDSETAACNNTHSQCVTSCGDGTKTDANGLPTPDPNYQGCVKDCNNKLCSCLDDCGSECDSSKGNLSGS